MSYINAHQKKNRELQLPVFYVFDNTEFKGYNNKRDSLAGGAVGSSP